ncbi:MAG TPA: BrnA antitoxin family protein [Pseudolabrys sp.]|nr:BrnA antitoxin family protein [Pseudolabrys sp.]
MTADRPEPTDKQTAKGSPFNEDAPKLHDNIQQTCSSPNVESPKEAVTLHVSPDTIEKFMAAGKDWRAKMAKALERVKL